MWFVYILKSLNRNWYYVGSTNNLFRRIKEHNNGLVKSTKFFKPLNLVYQLEFSTEIEARKYEIKVKKCRKEKEKLIRIIKTDYSGIV